MYFFIKLVTYIFMTIIHIQPFLWVLLHVLVNPSFCSTLDLSCNSVDLISGSRVYHFLSMYMPFSHNVYAISSQQPTGNYWSPQGQWQESFHVPSFNVVYVVPSMLSNHTDSFSYFHKLIWVFSLLSASYKDKNVLQELILKSLYFNILQKPKL